MNKHLIWAVTIVSIVAMICGTLIWINYNSWTVRFEMDNNTRDAIESIEYPIANINENQACHNFVKNSSGYFEWYGCGNEKHTKCSLMNCTVSDTRICVDSITGENATHLCQMTEESNETKPWMRNKH